MKKIKSENRILIMLAFFSISMGLWENFRQLWLQDNNFTVTGISNIISIGTLISVIGIALIGKYIKLDKLRKFVIYALIVKFINILLLLYLNNNNNNDILINISIIIDILAKYLITTSIYPLITTIIKNNTIYSKRKLTEYLFSDIGILIGGVLIGNNVIGILVDYNMCLCISEIFLIFSVIAMFNISDNKSHEEKKAPQISIIKYILKSKLQTVYIIFIFIGNISMSTALGLKMLTFTNYLGFSDSGATNYFLIIGLIADGIGILAFKFLTSKNDYITITIKFGIRLILYIIAFISNNIWITLIAITWSLLISTAYENICDGYYINDVKNEYQLEYTNFRYIVKYLGESIGIFLCGLMYKMGLNYMFGLSSVFLIYQLFMSYYLIYLRHNNKLNKEQ